MIGADQLADAEGRLSDVVEATEGTEAGIEGALDALGVNAEALRAELLEYTNVVAGDLARADSRTAWLAGMFHGFALGALAGRAEAADREASR